MIDGNCDSMSCSAMAKDSQFRFHTWDPLLILMQIVAFQVVLSIACLMRCSPTTTGVVLCIARGGASGCDEVDQR